MAQDAERLINLMPAYQMNLISSGQSYATGDGRKQLVHARWGLPSPCFALKRQQRRKPINSSPKAGRLTSKN